MRRVRVDVVYLVPSTLMVVMAINRWGLWSRIMTAAGMEQLALSTIRDEQKVKSGRQKLFLLQQKTRKASDDELENFI